MKTGSALLFPNARAMSVFAFGAFLLLISSPSFQSQDIYYDSLWNETSKENAVYYRIIDTISKKNFAVTDYFLNGKVQMTGQYSSLKKETKEGEFIWYREDGSISSRGHYKKGVYNGLYKSWYQNDNPKFEAYYADGKPDGSWKEWYENGNLMRNNNFKKGKPHGTCEEFYENGLSYV